MGDSRCGQSEDIPDGTHRSDPNDLGPSQTIPSLRTHRSDSERSRSFSRGILHRSDPNDLGPSQGIPAGFLRSAAHRSDPNGQRNAFVRTVTYGRKKIRMMSKAPPKAMVVPSPSRVKSTRALIQNEKELRTHALK